MLLTLIAPAATFCADADAGAAAPAAAADSSASELKAEGDPMEFIKQGGALIKKGNLSSAEVMLTNAVELAEAQGNSKALVYAYSFLDYIFTTKGYRDKAVENLEKLLPLQENDPKNYSKNARKLADLCLDTGRFERAVKYYDIAKSAYNAAGNTNYDAYIDSSVAMAYSGMGEFNKATEIYSALLENVKSAGDATGTVSLLINIGDIEKTRSNFDAALGIYNEALGIAEENKRDADSVFILNNIALTYQSMPDLEKAREAVNKALEIAQATGYEAGLASCYHQLGILDVHAGDASAAIENFKKAQDLKEALSDPTLGSTLAETGRAYYFRGNYKPARRFYRDALNTGLPADVRITVTNNLAMVFKMQGMLEYSLEMFNESLTTARGLNLRYQTSFLLNNIGVVLRELGRYDEAMEKHAEALEIDRETGARLDALVDVNNIALVHKEKGELDEALELLLGVIDEARELNSADDLLRTLVNLGDVYLLQKDFSKAIEYYNEAADIAGRTYSRERQWNALYGKGQALAESGDADGAIDTLKEAVEVIETIRADVGDDAESKSFFLADKVKVYNALIILLHGADRPGEALDYLERMKSRSLLDLIQKGRARIDKGLSEEEIAQENELKKELALATQQLGKVMASDGMDSPAARDAKANLDSIRAKTNEFRDALYLNHPKLAFARGENKPVTHKQAQDFLNEREIIVSYMLGEETSYAWTLSKEAVKMYDLETPAETINFTIDKKLREALEDGVWGSSQERAAKKVYEMVIAPIEADLEGREVMGIMPDGRLYELPFYLLMNKQKEYFIDKMAVFYLPSLSVMIETRKARAALQTEERVLAFGNPTFNTDTLVPLPGTEAEVGKILDIFGDRAKAYFHEDALEEHVKYFGKDYRLLHLASHGLLNNNNPLFSSIAMSQVGEQEGDGYLEAREIANLELGAELVVLSACESGRGRLQPGEGILGLTRSVFSAGVPGIIASMWSVNDEATSYLMQDFYARLKTETPTEALRHAQLATRENIGENPNLWAPFVLIGYGLPTDGEAAE